VEPHLSTPPSTPLDARAAELSGPGSELWREVAAWLTGLSGDESSSSSLAGAAPALVERALATASEVERTDAACALGKLCRAGSPETLAKLLALFMGEERGSG
jgi:hypothetical protein